MIKPVKKDDIFIINNRKYTVLDLCQASESKCVYKIKSEQGVTYILKEVITDSFVIRDCLYRNESNVACPDQKQLSSLGIMPEEVLCFTEPIGIPEQLNNETVIQDTAAENNSNYFFQTEKVLETPGAAYFLVNTEAGDPLDRLAAEWRRAADGDRLLLEVTRLMIKLTDALIYLHLEKRMLHLDIKPQNIYGIGKGFERTIKLIDLGSAVRIDQLKDDANKLLYTRSTFLYESPLQRKITEATDQDDKRLLKFIQELSVKDDIYAAAIVMKYLLGVDEGVVSLPNTNHYCLELLNEIIGKATSGGKIETCGLSFQTAHYDSVVQMKDDLIKLSNALLGAGINKTILLENGEKYVRQKMSEKGAFVNGAYRIDEALIPSVRRRSEDDGSDEKTVVDLNELSGSEKKNLFIVSEGGTGKTYLLWKTYLDHAACGDMIPIYIPLNRMDASEDPLLYFIANEYTDYQSEDKARTILAYFRKHIEHRFLILADGLNEIPATKPQIKKKAINNLIDDLSVLPNVSVVVTSRREDIAFSSFDQYELLPLDEDVLKSKVPHYDDLSDELRRLLDTPFNLSLYLHLPEDYRNTVIETATDLLEANIKWLKEKLSQQGVLDGTIGFLFDLLLPVLSYQLSKKNRMNFSKREFVDTAKRWATIIGDDETDKYDAEAYSDENDEDTDAYLEICAAIVSAEGLTKKLIVKELVNYLTDNAIIYRSTDGSYEFYHQNIRDFFAAKGWMIHADHYKKLYNREGEKLSSSIFIAPLSIQNHLKHFIKAKNIDISAKAEKMAEDQSKSKSNGRIAYCYFDCLFNNSTRDCMNSAAARQFNRVIIDTIKSLDKVESLHGERILSEMDGYDFSGLDLTLVNFSGCKLSNCSFKGSMLNMYAFHNPVYIEMPDVMWNNDSVVILFYKTREHLIRVVDINTGLVKCEIHGEFCDFCVIGEVMYAYDIEREGIHVFNLSTGSRLRFKMIEREVLKKTAGRTRRFERFVGIFDLRGKLCLVFAGGILSFDPDTLQLDETPVLFENVFLECFKPDLRLEENLLDLELRHFERNDTLSHTICNSRRIDGYLILYKYSYDGLKFGSDFGYLHEMIILKFPDESYSIEPIIYGPFSETFLYDDLEIVGRAVINGQLVITYFDEDNELAFDSFDLDENEQKGDYGQKSTLLSFIDRFEVCSYDPDLDSVLMMQTAGENTVISQNNKIICTLTDGKLSVYYHGKAAAVSDDEVSKPEMIMDMGKDHVIVGYSVAPFQVCLLNRDFSWDVAYDVKKRCFVRRRNDTEYKSRVELEEMIPDLRNYEYSEKYIYSELNDYCAEDIVDAPVDKTGRHNITYNYFALRKHATHFRERTIEERVSEIVKNTEDTYMLMKAESILCVNSRYLCLFVRKDDLSDSNGSLILAIDFKDDSVSKIPLFGTYGISRTMYTGMDYVSQVDLPDEEYRETAVVFLAESEDILYELRVDFASSSCEEIYCGEFLTDVRLYNCDFSRTLPQYPEYNYRMSYYAVRDFREDLEASPESYLDRWIQNNII